MKLEALRAEISAVDELIQLAKEVGDLAVEEEFSKRKKSIEEQISSLEGEYEKFARVILFFGGEPVYGSRGVSAKFAGAALEGFQNLVSTVFAVQELSTMGERGPIPLQKSSNLMVTEIAKGSFGFLLDEIHEQEDIFDTNLKQVVEDVATLLKRTASYDELEFEEALETLDSRTLTPLKDFFEILYSNNATLRLKEDIFDFTIDELSIERARKRTQDTHITPEKDEFLIGILIGVLPNHQKFEAKSNDGKDIYGTVAKEAVEQYNTFINSGDKVTGERWKLKIQHRTVKPLNRPPREVYRLLEFVEKVDSK